MYAKHIPIFTLRTSSQFFKCYFKRKYLNLIDSNCDVDKSCPWFLLELSLPQALNVLSIYRVYHQKKGNRTLMCYRAIKIQHTEIIFAYVVGKTRLSNQWTVRAIIESGNFSK